MDKTLNKFKYTKSSDCHSNQPRGNSLILHYYSFILFKVPKIDSRFGFKVFFKPANKVKISPLKEPIPSENRRGIDFIP